MGTFTAPAPELPYSATRFERATAQDFGSEIGAGVSNIGRGIAQYQADAAADEQRRAIVGASQIRAKYAKALDEATLSGAPLEPIKQAMNDDLAKVGEDFQTKQGQAAIALHTANSNLMFDEQANRIDVQRAGAQARLQGKEFIDSESAQIQSNPLYLDTAVKNAAAFVQTLRVPPDTKATIQQGIESELNMGAAMASARIDPEATKLKLEGGAWKLSPEQRRTAISQADTRIREIRADATAQRVLAEYEERKADSAAAQGVLGHIFDGTFKQGFISDNADLKPETKENLTRFYSWFNTEKGNKPHPAAMMDLWLAIHAPDDDPRKVYNADSVFQAAEQGRINSGEAETAAGWVARQRDENYNTFSQKLRAKLMTIRAGMTADPKWAEQGELSSAVQLEVANRAEQTANELRRENKDPSQIFDPHSKFYAFNPQLLSSVASDIRSSATIRPAPKTQAEYDALEPGTPYVDTDGVTKVKKSNIEATPAQAHATALDIQSRYIDTVPHGRGQYEYRINAPNRSPAHRLNGKTFPTREAAIEALKGL